MMIRLVMADSCLPAPQMLAGLLIPLPAAVEAWVSPAQLALPRLAANPPASRCGADSHADA
jgi:hypothetical protein